jgi:hypothetical protein
MSENKIAFIEHRKGQMQIIRTFKIGVGIIVAAGVIAVGTVAYFAANK